MAQWGEMLIDWGMRTGREFQDVYNYDLETTDSWRHKQAATDCQQKFQEYIAWRDAGADARFLDFGGYADRVLGVVMPGGWFVAEAGEGRTGGGSSCGSTTKDPSPAACGSQTAGSSCGSQTEREPQPCPPTSRTSPPRTRATRLFVGIEHPPDGDSKAIYFSPPEKARQLMYALVERSWPDEEAIVQAAIAFLIGGIWNQHGEDCGNWVPVLIDQVIAEKRYALDIEQHAYKCPWIPSDFNYQAYMCWLSAQPLGVALHLGQALPLINHRDAPPGVIFIGGRMYKVRDIEAKLAHPESTTPLALKNIQCEEETCYRCQHQCGGYRFHWVGPWTCRRVAMASPQEATISKAMWLNCADCEACRGPARRRPPGIPVSGYRGP